MIASLERLPVVDRVQEDEAEVREDSRGEEYSSVEYREVVVVEVDEDEVGCLNATGAMVGGTSLLIVQ